MAEEIKQEYDIEILDVTDMQNGFITGTLKNDTAKKIIPAVLEEINQWKAKKNCIIVATRDTHFKDSYVNSVEGKLLPLHCEYGTHDWEIEASIMKALEEAGAKFVDKHNFGYINWPKVLFNIDSTDQDAVAALLAGKKIRIRIVGTCTDICNLSQLVIFRAWFPNADIEIVDGACAASFEDESPKTRDAAFVIANSMLCKVVPTVYKG